MKTTASLAVLVLGIGMNELIAQEVGEEGLSYPPAVVYQAPVVYNAPVIYQAPVVYEAPVVYQAPAAPTPVLNYYPDLPKVVIFGNPADYDPCLYYNYYYQSQPIYFGGRQGAIQGYQFGHQR